MIPRTLTLQGEHVRLEPLAFAHAEDLFTHGNDPEVWSGAARSNQMATLDKTREYIAEALFGSTASPDCVPFAVIHRASGRAVGSTRFFEISEPEKRLEIGYTWYGRAHWRTAINTECKLLLMEYAFESAGMRRVQLKADAGNTRSRTAILRLGAVYEGTLRDYRLVEESIRSVSMYSVLAAEWPAVRERLRGALTRAA